VRRVTVAAIAAAVLLAATGYSWGYGHTAPATFVAAWRHVVRVFRAAGAANVTWLWTVNSIQGASSSLSQWWPDAAWVSWTGIAGYFSMATDSFGSVFGSTIADIRTWGLPGVRA
jgi:mannan endo-1,4-beta-mannosidase